MAAVSVLIPCFRCASTVGRAVASALGQSQPPLEVILVDDGSPDESPQVLADLARRHGERIRVVRLQRNGGVSAARNVAWEAASGLYVALLDSDDTWHPRKLETQVAFMRAHPEFPMTAHLHLFADDLPAAVPPGERAPFTEIPFRYMLYRNWFHTSSVMLRRDLPQRFVPAKRYGEDRQLWLDVAGAGQRIARLDIPLARIYKMPYSGTGLSADLWAMESAELDTFRGLHRSGLISRPVLCLVFAWSFVRFLRRLAVVALRRARMKR